MCTVRNLGFVAKVSGRTDHLCYCGPMFPRESTCRKTAWPYHSSGSIARSYNSCHHRAIYFYHCQNGRPRGSKRSIPAAARASFGKPLQPVRSHTVPRLAQDLNTQVTPRLDSPLPQGYTEAVLFTRACGLSCVCESAPLPRKNAASSAEANR